MKQDTSGVPEAQMARVYKCLKNIKQKNEYC